MSHTIDLDDANVESLLKLQKYEELTSILATEFKLIEDEFTGQRRL